MQLEEMFREVVNVAVPPEADLIESGLIDSLALVELLFAIEQRFGVDLAAEELDIESFRTIDSLAAAIVEAAPSARPATG
jgi:acyl carrier protein